MCSWEQIFVKHERPCVILLQKIIMEVPIIAAAYSITIKVQELNILEKKVKFLTLTFWDLILKLYYATIALLYNQNVIFEDFRDCLRFEIFFD